MGCPPLHRTGASRRFEIWSPRIVWESKTSAPDWNEADMLSCWRNRTFLELCIALYQGMAFSHAAELLKKSGFSP